MTFPPKKIGFLPVMFETIRIPVTDNLYVIGLKLINQNGGSIILYNIAAIIQPSSKASFLSISMHLFFISFFLFR
jgi:hypothetical protein